MARSPRSLTGTVVAVVGGARGIGRATAAALARRGARVAIGDLDGELAAEVARELGAGAFGRTVDVTSRRSYEAFLDAAEHELGPLEVLVSSAGIMPLAPLMQETDASAHHTVEVNLQGALLGAKLAAARFLPRGRGELVMISGIVGRPGVGAMGGGVTYAATQQGLAGMTEALRGELGREGVAVRQVAVALVDTEMTAGLRRPRVLRAATPEEVAAGVIRALQFELEQVNVPAWLGRRLELIALLPAGVRRTLARMLRTDRLLADPDPVRRAAYEARVLPPSARDRAATVAIAARSVAEALQALDHPSAGDSQAGDRD